jgi:hypothetical protein
MTESFIVPGKRGARRYCVELQPLIHKYSESEELTKIAHAPTVLKT